MKFVPHDYQRRGIRFIEDHRRCCLFWDMGLGKSVVTLTAVSDLIDLCEVSRVLVVAPKKVAESTWSGEAEKWDSLSGLRVSCVLGSQMQRVRALEEKADVYVISRDNLVWLLEQAKEQRAFDMLVLDELTSFKSSKAKRFKAARMLSLGAHRVVGLTGTPIPNGYADLWAEMYCIDQGERLGRYKTRYMDAYFKQIVWNNVVIKTTLRDGADKIIRNKISDICMSLKASDYLSLPPMQVINVDILMPEAAMNRYRKLEKEKVLSLTPPDGEEEPREVVAANAAALMNKLSQMSSGAVYDADGLVTVVHDAKIERLKELVEAAGSPVLVYYQYKHEASRILEALKGVKVELYGNPEQLTRWNAGQIDVLLAHPQSAAFGLNMQGGGHYIVWTSTGWNLELYKQANARLHRQGQEKPVTVYNLICRGTVDELCVAALQRKDNVQEALFKSFKELQNKYLKQ